MKYFVFIISFLFSNNLLSQKIEYKIYFLEDSIKIGNPITLISTLNYPETIELIQPDSSYNFMSFDFIRKKIFPSLIKKNRVYDSTVYFLRTFEIDSIQKVYLNALILDKNDSIKISSNEDSISLIYQVEDIESKAKENTLLKSMGFLKNKAKTLEDIWNNAQYIISNKIEIGADDKKLIDELSKKVISDFASEYEKLSSLSRETLEPVIKSLIDKHKTNFKGVGQPLRIALVGSRFGPGIYDVILSLDKSEVIKRLKQI